MEKFEKLHPAPTRWLNWAELPMGPVMTFVGSDLLVFQSEGYHITWYALAAWLLLASPYLITTAMWWYRTRRLKYNTLLLAGHCKGEDEKGLAHYHQSPMDIVLDPCKDRKLFTRDRTLYPRIRRYRRVMLRPTEYLLRIIQGHLAAFNGQTLIFVIDGAFSDSPSLLVSTRSDISHLDADSVLMMVNEVRRFHNALKPFPLRFSSHASLMAYGPYTRSDKDIPDTLYSHVMVDGEPLFAATNDTYYLIDTHSGQLYTRNENAKDVTPPPHRTGHTVTLGGDTLGVGRHDESARTYDGSLDYD